MIRSIMVGVFAVAASWGVVATATADLVGVELTATQVADSQVYFVYTYELTNPAASTWAIAYFRLDISASSGTPNNLPITGSFLDLTASPGGGAESPHAEVGPIAPAGWSATLNRRAELSWYPPQTFLESDDSVAPGATKDGFGIRSSYLPGVTTVIAQPTPESCCAEPLIDEGIEYRHMPNEYPVAGWTIAPRYMPEEIDIDLLQSQLSTVCAEPLWVDDSALCAGFGDLLDLAAVDADENNFYGAAAVLNNLLQRVNADQAEMHSNAYWLLSLNVERARANLLSSASNTAYQWHFRTIPNDDVTAEGWTLSSSTQQNGSVWGNIAAASSEWFYFVREMDSAAPFADGEWSVQLELFEMSANDGGLSLHDVRVQRYNSSGTLLETKYIHQGEVMTIPAGTTRVSLTETLTGWSGGSAGDFQAVSFRLQNDNAAAAEAYAIRAGTAQADWGASWLSQPK